MKYDVLVIGGDNAAVCAALTAREWCGGNSAHTRNVGCMHEAPQDVLVDAYPGEEYCQNLLKVTGGSKALVNAHSAVPNSSMCTSGTTRRLTRLNSTTGVYALFPHNTLAEMFGAVFGFAVLALGIGVPHFWRAVTTASYMTFAPGGSVGEAVQNALALTYLDGGHGKGCNNEDDRFTRMRRVFQHLTFYSFMGCFAATLVATLYHFVLGLHAPYPLFSAPALLGAAGGIALTVGAAGLPVLNQRRHLLQGDANRRPMGPGVIGLLLLIAVSGLALLAGRDSGAMALLLALHLGAVIGLSRTLPYGKFAHGIYCCAALLKFSIETRRPTELKLAND